MGTIKIGSSKEQKGITIDPLCILFNGNNVKKINKGETCVVEIPKDVWFRNGKFINEDIFGTPQFYFRDGVNNYEKDGYIFLPTTGMNGDSIMYSSKIIPRGKYKKVEVTYILTNQYYNDIYRFGFGLTATQKNYADVGAREYKTSKFAISTSKTTQSFDLTGYNASGTDLYFFLGGVATAQIFNISFYE